MFDFLSKISLPGLRFGGPSGPLVEDGTGTPEGVVTAPVGSLYLRNNGAAGSTLYVKETGVGNTGWVPVNPGGPVDNATTNAKLADMATQTVKARNTAATGDPEDVPTATLKSTMLGIGIATIAALRLLGAEIQVPTVWVKEYETGTYKGGGDFVHVASDTTTADNGGVVIVDAASRRWYRVVDDGGIDATHFGLVGGGIVDDSAAMQRAVTHGATNTVFGTVRVPAGNFLINTRFSALKISNQSLEFGLQGAGKNNTRFIVDGNQVTRTITAVTRGVTTTITYSGTDIFTNGGTIIILGVGGTTQLNRNVYTLANVNTTANTFQIKTTVAGVLVDVDSTAYGVFTSGGTASTGLMHLETVAFNGLKVTLNDFCITGRNGNCGLAITARISPVAAGAGYRRSLVTSNVDIYTENRDTDYFAGGIDATSCLRPLFENVLISNATSSPAAVQITSLTRVTNVVTVVTDTPHGLVVGNPLQIESTTSTTYRGFFTVSTVPNTTTVTYAQTAADLTENPSPGTITTQTQYLDDSMWFAAEFGFNTPDCYAPNFNRCSIWGANIGYKQHHTLLNLEGYHLDNCGAVLVRRGISRVHPSGSDEPGGFCIKCHFNARDYGAYFDGVRNCFFLNCIFYDGDLPDVSTEATPAHIRIVNGGNAFITGNIFGYPGSTTKRDIWLLDAAETPASVYFISGNAFLGTLMQWHIYCPSNPNIVEGNNYYRAPRAIWYQNASSTMATMEQGPASLGGRSTGYKVGDSTSVNKTRDEGFFIEGELLAPFTILVKDAAGALGEILFANSADLRKRGIRYDRDTHEIQYMSSGVLKASLDLNGVWKSSNVLPVTTAAHDLGSSSLLWRDLYLSGAVQSQLNLFTGTATVAPLKHTAGVLLTTPVAGTQEFTSEGYFSTIGTTSGRARNVIEHSLRLAANGAAIGPTIDDFFGANSAFPTVLNGVYEFEFEIYFLKTTAGTVIFTITNTQVYANIVADYIIDAVGGLATNAAPTRAGIVATTSAAAALPVTASLTTATNHKAIIKATVECAAAGNIRLRITSSAGTVTPLRGSIKRVRRIPAANTGIFVA